MPQGLEQTHAQFQRKAQLLGALSHPNLPHAYDFFNANGNEHAVMEFIARQNLHDAVMSRGAINAGAARA